MAQTTTSNSVPLNNAAKDDTITGVTFSINDLLGNDPGGAAKLDLTKQFFFGNTAADQADQAGYLAAHKITDNGDGTYTIGAGATDFNYFVQIGNKGTWSTASVDITAPVPHAGDALFTENFDGYDSSVQQTYKDDGVPVFATVDLTAANGWVSTGSDATKSELGADGYGGIKSTSGGFWFDTQNTPGQVNISHSFTDLTAAVDGKTAVLSFDIAKQALNYQDTDYATDPNASFAFKIDGVTVATVTAAELMVDNVMTHFEIGIAGYGDMTDNTHTLEMVDTSTQSSVTGFAVDSIKISDWVI